MEATLITMITKPFSLFMLALIFCLKTLFTVIHTWVELLKAMIHLHLNMFRVIMISIVALVLLPVRVLTGSMQAEGLIHHLSPDLFSSGNLFLNRALEERREVAISQSLFSAFLSLLVGMIIWEAEDPCMPLVVALFIVVGISLKSVVLFFSTIKNKPASDAVALLSFNCFILGTLTYPTLPRVARLFAPVYSSFP